MTESKCECPKCNCDKESASIPGPLRYGTAKEWIQDPEKKDLIGNLFDETLCEDCLSGLHLSLDNKQKRI